MRTSLLITFSILLLAGCTADDDLEGKKCDLSKPEAQQCVADYKCICHAPPDPESCFCEKSVSSMTQELSGEPAMLRSDLRMLDPSWCFLNRLDPERFQSQP